jgi:hypothetical protein
MFFHSFCPIRLAGREARLSTVQHVASEDCERKKVAIVEQT